MRLSRKAVLGLIVTLAFASDSANAQSLPSLSRVSADNFARAETDVTIAAYVKEGALGKFVHSRTPASIEDQKIVRMNRDTLYSIAVFDLDAGPVTVALPDAGNRYMMAQVIDQDHYTHDITYSPASKTYSRDGIGTRYAVLIIRTLVDPENPLDLKQVHSLQDAIKVEQAAVGSLEVPSWDPDTQSRVRDALKVLGNTLLNSEAMFGTKNEVNPIHHLIGAAVGWGGNPSSAALYLTSHPRDDDPNRVHTLTVKDVPVDGFWSISVYNSKGFFEKNKLNAYSINNLTAKPERDGTVRVKFGGCDQDKTNCLPITKGWNYTVRLYRPRAELLDGKWKFPDAVP